MVAMFVPLKDACTRSDVTDNASAVALVDRLEKVRESLCLSVMVAMFVPLKDACTRSDVTDNASAVALVDAYIPTMVDATPTGM